ncbi:hypothetical protein GT037_007614 [Alternaria burnsii]|uniref:Uncharacterized protein n=1 Tax=Alternaria burnsii TaxID=1187904 RepID=A0A8H7B0R0_9PLEO|nr:uncharacterized protein GT037_007614 [Alternaria burnsii]KAF7674854.1 hypothetical protein GT037_007614 [Alternaria burnsii]
MEPERYRNPAIGVAAHEGPLPSRDFFVNARPDSTLTALYPGPGKTSLFDDRR